ncbi:hypothetical protein [Roseovarius azorensis]|uniref:hypothetical protein n=1 Tax=Roseovarius azorensis TaxID=1287727 RepID=UPI001114E222|nr:hypothetical protein [Roseovarius azorensis]
MPPPELTIRSGIPLAPKGWGPHAQSGGLRHPAVRNRQQIADDPFAPAIGFQRAVVVDQSQQVQRGQTTVEHMRAIAKSGRRRVPGDAGESGHAASFRDVGLDDL